MLSRQIDQVFPINKFSLLLLHSGYTRFSGKASTPQVETNVANYIFGRTDVYENALKMPQFVFYFTTCTTSCNNIDASDHGSHTWLHHSSTILMSPIVLWAELWAQVSTFESNLETGTLCLCVAQNVVDICFCFYCSHQRKGENTILNSSIIILGSHKPTAENNKSGIINRITSIYVRDFTPTHFLH